MSQKIETLLEDTISLMQARIAPMSEVHRRTGLDRTWMYRVMNGDIPDPSVKKIVKLNLVLREMEKEMNRRKQHERRVEELRARLDGEAV